METRSMEITLISACDLKTASMLYKTKAYAIAWISNDHKNRQWTPMDKENGTNPTWNQVMRFTLDEAALQQGRLVLEIAIYADGAFGDKEIGRVRITLNEFLKPAGSNKGASTTTQFVSYQVRKPSGKAKGVLHLSVRLAEKADIKLQQQQLQAVMGSYGAANEEPVTAFPAGLYGAANEEPVTAFPAGLYGAAKTEPVIAYPGYPLAGSSSYTPANNQCPPPLYPPQACYPPPPPPYYQGYPPPPTPPYYQDYPPPPTPPCYQGYPPPPTPPYYQGYPPPPAPPYQGYPPIVPSVQQQPRKNNKPGMGLGAGLIGGALGGLLLGDLIGGAF